MPKLSRLSVALVAVTLALLAAAPPTLAKRPRSIKLKFPRFEVPARSDREVCTFVRLPMRKPFDAAGSVIVNLGGDAEFVSHHFLLYAYTGTDMAAFGPAGQISDSKACLDFGPVDRNQRVLIGGSQTPRSRQILPDGLAQRIMPNTAGGTSELGLILNTHWINGSNRPHRASVKMKLMPAKPGTIKRFMQPIFEPVASGLINVPPGQVETVEWGWRPGGVDYSAGLGGVVLPKGPACVASVTAHMHKRGKLFSVDFVDRDGTVTPLYSTSDYSDPGQRIFFGEGGRDALLVSPGQKLVYRCTHDNGVTTEQKLGCEETPGVPPGESAATTIFAGRGFSGAAKRCKTDGDCPATDPAYLGRQFTGKCVPANLVFGFTSDDDMCILPGAYYEADPVHGCDLGPLPVIR